MQTVVTTTVVEAKYTAATEGLTSLPFGHTSLPSHVVPPPVVSISINSDDSPPYLNGCNGIDKGTSFSLLQLEDKGTSFCKQLFSNGKKSGYENFDYV